MGDYPGQLAFLAMATPRWARRPECVDFLREAETLVKAPAPPRVLVAAHGYVGALAFSPDGKTLAFGGAGVVHLFDLTK